MNLPDDFDARIPRDRLVTGCETMHRLIEGLLNPDGNLPQDIHAIRKLGKSLRGGLALFRLDKSAALDIQAIGRLFSGRRDAVSRLHTWQKLGWSADPATAAAISALLEQQTRSAELHPAPETVLWALTRVTAAKDNLQALPLENLNPLISSGLKKLETKIHKRCRKLDHRAEHNFHEARKALKAWLGATSYLPDGMADSDPLPCEIAELLGDENDLATLSLWLQSHGFTAHFAPDLWQTIKNDRRKIQRKVIRKATDFTKTRQAGIP